MAARVNVRFVAILCTIVGVVFVGMAGAAYFIVKKSAADHYQTAQELEQAGNFEEARQAYSKAVNKEPTNVVYLQSWIESLERLTPETQTSYSDVYWKSYVPGLRSLAMAQRTNVDAWDRFLGTQYEQRNVFGSGGRSGWQSLLSETNYALDQFLISPEGDDDQADWHRLRRYRALSNLNMRLAHGDPDEESKDKTILDFEAVLRVDPDDAEAAVGLYEWLMAEADDARGSRADPQVYLDQAREALDSFLAQNPNHPRVMIARLYYDLQVAARPLRELRTQEERVRANLALASEYKPQVEAIVDRVLSQSPPELLNIEVVQLVHRLERLTSPGTNEIPLTDRTLEAVRQAAEGDPGTLAQINFFEGVFASESNEHERAIEAFERVMDSPEVPISLDGIILNLLEGQAVLRRAQSAVDIATAAEGDAVAPARERVAAFREEVDKQWPQGTPSVLLLDARIAYLEGELAKAQGLAVSYQREAGGNDPQTHFLLSRIYMERNQVGQAVDELEKFVELSPNVPQAWAMLSDLQDRIGNTSGARESIERARQLAPDDERIQRRYENIRIRTGQMQSDDPIQQTLIKIDRWLDTTGGVSPRYGDAERELSQLMDRSDDARLYNAMATLQAMQRKLDEAAATVEAGLARHPDNTLLQQLDTRIKVMGGDIDELDLSPVRREMLLFRMAMRDGRREDANRHLDAAVRIAPDDSEVLQTRILRAMEAEDWTEAERLIARATELNADQAGGRLLRANLLQARGRSAEALALVNAVISDGLTSVPVLYRRAQILRSLGRNEDAVSDYLEILRRQPDSVTNVRDVIVALAEMGRTRQALDIARRSQRIAGSDPTFLNQWLSLEAQVGDSTAAMLRREGIRTAEPDNRQNNLALASVYVRLSEWPKAREIIDELRAEEDDVALVMLDARWHAEQGQMRNAVAVFDQYMAARDRAGELDARDVLSYANFLQRQGQAGLAIEKLRAALDQDTDQTQPIRRRLALLLLSAGRADEAVAVIDELIASGQDTDGMLKLARVEAYLRGNQLDQAEQALNGLERSLANSEAAGILRADLALARGDRPAAREAIRNTLASHPTSARAYVRQAQLRFDEVRTDESLGTAERTQLLREAGEDLDEAIRQDASNWEAHRLQALIAMENGRYNVASRAVSKALELNPGLGRLRNQLVRRLVQEGDTPRAMSVIDAAIQSNPADVDLRVNMARLMADLGRATESIRLFEQALEQRRNPEIAAQFVEFLLNQDTAQARTKARQVLSDPFLPKDVWQLRLMSASLAMQEGNRPRAISEAIQSFAMVREDMSRVIRWFNALPPLIKDHATRMEIALQLAPERTPQRVGEIMMASLMLQDPSTEQQGLSELTRLAGDRNPVVATRSGQLLGDAYYEREDYEKAAQAWRGVVDLEPNASQSLNNLAYVLASELGQCEQAIELAQRAKAIGGVAPAIVQSTLVVAYLECDRLDRAQQAVDELSEVARGTAEESLAAIRQGQVDLALGRTDQARVRAVEAEELLESWGGRAEAYRSILEEFKTALEDR